MAQDFKSSYRMPPVHSPFFDRLLDAIDFTDFERRVAIDINRRGYAVIDFEEPDFNDLAAEIIEGLKDRFPARSDRRDLHGWKEFEGARGWTTNPIVKHLVLKLYGPRPTRVTDAWTYCDAVRRIAVNPAILRLLSKLYGRRPIPFQTLNFNRGTQQKCHADTIHFNSVPQGYMCGVWVALENIDEDNGPVQYYPGSHLEPPIDHQIFERRAVDFSFGRRSGSYKQRHIANYSVFEDYWQDLIAAKGWRREIFTCRKGTALIWAANLLHGGAPVRDHNRTRHSQVTHYYFENCLYYKPLWSDPMLGRIRQRKVVDITTGRRVKSRYGGRPVRLAWRDYI